MWDMGDRYLMMIEPPIMAFTPDPIEDSYSKMADMVMTGCRKAQGGYKGCHTSSCGERSDNRDHITPKGRTTHSLMPHYVKHFRDAIPPLELNKLAEEFELISKATVEDADRLVTKGFREQLRRAADALVKTQDPNRS